VSREERNYVIEFDVDQFGSPVLQWAFAGILTEWTPGEIAPGVALTIRGSIQPVRDISADLP